MEWVKSKWMSVNNLNRKKDSIQHFDVPAWSMTWFFDD